MESDALFWSDWVPGIHVVLHTYMQTKHSCTLKNKDEEKCIGAREMIQGLRVLALFQTT